MVRLEELEALDLLVWLQSGFTAAALAGTNQSTICRRAKRVLSTFEARLLRERDGWRVHSPLLALLDLQRQIHQQWRLKSHRGLRLNVPAWSLPAVQLNPPRGWIFNPQDGPLVCDNPLDLLRAHVIDACLVTPTQLAGGSHADLVLFDLYATRIDLLAPVGRDGQAVGGESPQCAEALLSRGCLDLRPFLPASCRASSRQRFDLLRGDLGLSQTAPVGSAAAVPLAFLTPVMALGLADRRPLPVALEWPYRESLAVLRHTAEQPAIQALVERLQRELPRTLRGLVPDAVEALG